MPDEDTGMDGGGKEEKGRLRRFLYGGRKRRPSPFLLSGNRNDSTIPRGDGMKAKTVRTVFVLVFGLTWLMQSMVLANTAGVYQVGPRNQVTVDQTGTDQARSFINNSDFYDLASQVDLAPVSELAPATGNYAEVSQLGAQNSASVRQQGLNYAHVDQFGEANRVDLQQDGILQGAIINQAGTDNSLYASQAGQLNMLAVNQVGVGNEINLTQDGVANLAALGQFGRDNVIDLTQVGVGNQAVIRQYGNGDYFSVSQTGFQTVRVTRYAR